MKKQNMILLLVSLFSSILVSAAQEDVLADGFLKEQYQDIVINNVVVKPGVRECAHRYEALKTILDRYQRPITVLDIGASQGYFSFKIAYEYDATCVMVEGDYNNDWRTTEQLLQLCKLNTELDNIVFLRHRITPAELERLATCEHFDVILAFNILHHVGSDWQRAADALFKMGDNIIIETPPSDDVFADKHPTIRPIEKYLFDQQGTVICETPRHTDPNVTGKMFWFERVKTQMQRRHWFEKKLYEPGYSKLVITSTNTEKTVVKTETNATYAWNQGINLLTFKMLGGAYPEPEMIERAVRNAYTGLHLDFFPWNMILQGENIATIDNDDGRWIFDPQASLDFSVQMLQNKTPQDVLSWYLAHWIPFAQSQGVYAHLLWCIDTAKVM
ncbi:MAG TPA: methyltransferase domain-containing protein [Candidatus Babeliales bacterium]|nr:methyltransferase domain-containing protein [Candidatus Babeliales bacterium]